MGIKQNQSKSLTRTLIYDIETSPAIGLFFGKPYEVNIAKIIQHEYVLGFAWKWLGEKKVHTCYVWDFSRHAHEPINDINVIKKWASVVSEADVIVGHNSDQFDYKHMFGRLMVHRLPPIAMPQTVDTKKAVKRVSAFASNKLDDLGNRFGIGRKMQHEGIELWWGCMQGDMKAQRKMVAYNKQDVKLTEELYLYELPYMATHPNRSNIIGRPEVCPRCESSKGFQSRGYRHTKVGRYQRFQCLSCYCFISHRTGEKNVKPSYV